MDRDEKFELYRLKMKDSLIDYFTEEIKINSDALKTYEVHGPIPEANLSAEVQRMRETQAIVLRDRINELNRHLAVIKRIV